MKKRIFPVILMFLGSNLVFSNPYQKINTYEELPLCVKQTVSNIFQDPLHQTSAKLKMALDWESFFLSLTRTRSNHSSLLLPENGPLKQTLLLTTVLHANAANLEQLKKDLTQEKRQQLKMTSFGSSIAKAGYSYKAQTFFLGFRGTVSHSKEDWLSNFGLLWDASVIKNPASTPLGQLELTRPFLQKISGFEKEQWRTIELNKIHSGMRIVLNLVLPSIMIEVEKVLDEIAQNFQDCFELKGLNGTQRKLLIEQLDNQKWKLAGHSRGGGIAMLTGLMLPEIVAQAANHWFTRKYSPKNEEFKYKKLHINLLRSLVLHHLVNSAINNTSIVTFASPKIFYQRETLDLDVIKWFKTHSVHFYSPHDPIPGLAFLFQHSQINPGIYIEEWGIEEKTGNQTSFASFIDEWKTFVQDYIKNVHFAGSVKLSGSFFRSMFGDSRQTHRPFVFLTEKHDHILIKMSSKKPTSP